MALLEAMKKYRVFLWLLTFLGILIGYYFTPIFEVEPKIACHGFYGLIENSAGAQIEPLCGDLIYGAYQQKPNFPHREKSGPRVWFCKKNIKNIENSCSVKVDEVLLDDELFVFAGRSKCKYIVFDSEKSLKDVFTITTYQPSLKLIKI